MQAPETELKFVVDDLAAFRSAVERLPLQLRTDRSFESNVLYDTPGRELRGKRQILRLRTYNGTAVVTHKRVPEDEPADVPYKTRIETETLVEDGAAIAEIFTQLGFSPAFRYEKFRTEWDGTDGGHLVLDETPIGNWAELEGDPCWIDRMLQLLHVPSGRCSTASYGALFLEWKDKNESPAQNLTFEEVCGAIEGAS